MKGEGGRVQVYTKFLRNSEGKQGTGEEENIPRTRN